MSLYQSGDVLAFETSARPIFFAYTRVWSTQKECCATNFCIERALDRSLCRTWRRDRSHHWDFVVFWGAAWRHWPHASSALL